MTILLLQHYIADIAVGSDKVSDGIESTGIPQGIPPLAEFLADYCSSAVSPVMVVVTYFFFQS